MKTAGADSAGTRVGASRAKEARSSETRASETRSGDTRERILDAAETLLRRHGLAKTTVVDVARMLGMSHANVYRHFASKAELQDTLVENWLRQVSEPLTEIAARDTSAVQRVEAWALALISIKRRKLLGDPELFAAYHEAAEASRAVVDRYIAGIRAQLSDVIADGVRRGEFIVDDPAEAALAVCDAASRFTHPHLVKEVYDADWEPRAKRVVQLVIAGLRAGTV